LENTPDSEWSVGDVETYLHALGLNGQLMVSRKDATIFDEIKHHAFRIRACLDQMVKLAGNDPEIGRGVSNGHIETVANLTRLVVQSLQNLPHMQKQFSLVMDTDDAGEAPIPPASPRNVEQCVTPAA